VEKMSLPNIEKTLFDLSQKAHDGTLAVEDLAGGTFTINNSTMYGSLLSTSMLASPQSAILGLHGIKERPSFYQGKVVPRPMMFLSLTYDHRIIDGREAVTFLKNISDSIADPRRMLVEL
jgi:2-oxoglutarate dehydrogenase E2 component (dihydrolipoamide succinyltransferase)